MAQFLTVDDMILCSYNSHLLLDYHSNPLPEKLDHAIHLIHADKLFGIELTGRPAEYFIKSYFPGSGYVHIFTLDVKEGDTRDKSSWVSIGLIGKCVVALYDPYAIAAWLAIYDGPIPEFDIQRYTIPLALIEDDEVY